MFKEEKIQLPSHPLKALHTLWNVPKLLKNLILQKIFWHNLWSAPKFSRIIQKLKIFPPTVPPSNPKSLLQRLRSRRRRWSWNSHANRLHREHPERHQSISRYNNISWVVQWRREREFDQQTRVESRVRLSPEQNNKMSLFYHSLMCLSASFMNVGY